MEIKDWEDLRRKYRYMRKNAFICYIIGLASILLYILILYKNYKYIGFISNSATVLLLSKLIEDMYEYFIAHIKFTSSTQYDGNKLKFSSIFLLVVNAIFYLISVVEYRMSFDISINNTIEGLLLTIALCIWTFVIIHSLNKVNSKMEEYIKIIKS